MKRSAANRFSALLAALLLLFTWTGDAVGLHPCPHHSAVARAGGGPAAGAGHGAHPEHDPAASAAAEHDRAPADHGAHGGCTCVGCCPAGVALPVFAVPFCDVGDAVPAASVAVADRGTGLPDRFPPFVLPYGLAPPALRA
ncbi:MAG: hypothetical protein ABW277_21460 [Longimicrobiaceae bacterium]